MLTKETYKSTALAIAVSLSLAACGGGGGSSTNTTAPASGASAPTGASTPAVDPNTNVAPQTSVAAATYSAASAQSAMYATLNSYRANIGVGLLSQNANLDVAAQAHSLYEQVNFNSGVDASLGHTEVSGNPAFYEATPYQRSVKAGSPANLWVGEDVAANYSSDGIQADDGTACMQGWLNTIYHLQGATSNTTAIGLGYVQPASTSKALFFCVADFGNTSSPAPSATEYNSNAFDGGQQIPVGTVVHAPYSNETNVALLMQPESPNPAPDVASPGRPIMVRVNQQAGDLLTVDTFQLTDGSGNVVPARIIVSQAAVSASTAPVTADVNGDYLAPGAAFLLPLSKLTASTTYTVSFAGKRDGVAVAPTTWQFRTAAN